MLCRVKDVVSRPLDGGSVSPVLRPYLSLIHYRASSNP